MVDAASGGRSRLLSFPPVVAVMIITAAVLETACLKETVEHEAFLLVIIIISVGINSYHEKILYHANNYLCIFDAV